MMLPTVVIFVQSVNTALLVHRLQLAVLQENTNQIKVLHHSQIVWHALPVITVAVLEEAHQMDNVLQVFTVKVEIHHQLLLLLYAQVDIIVQLVVSNRFCVMKLITNHLLNKELVQLVQLEATVLIVTLKEHVLQVIIVLEIIRKSHASLVLMELQQVKPHMQQLVLHAQPVKHVSYLLQLQTIKHVLPDIIVKQGLSHQSQEADTAKVVQDVHKANTEQLDLQVKRHVLQENTVIEQGFLNQLETVRQVIIAQVVLQKRIQEELVVMSVRTAITAQKEHQVQLLALLVLIEMLKELCC